MDKTTAKIDVQKLQLLNDRICQTIDALNQVRLSMHGFSVGYGQPVQTTAVNPFYGAQSFFNAPLYGTPVHGGIPAMFGGHNPYAFGGYSTTTLPWMNGQLPFYGVPQSPAAYQGWNQGAVSSTGFAPVHAPVSMPTVSPIY